jgi:ABC-type sugar transport system ATPase subunit
VTPERNAPDLPREQRSGNAVRVSGLTKSFGATRALKGVDFSVDFEETHALVGENGAGKSTLIRILSGVHRADSGTIEIAGEPRSFSNPRDAILAGIVTIPQELRMVPALSIAENIALGNQPVRRYLGILPGIDRKRMREEAKHYLDQLDFKPDLDRPVHSLSFAERQLVAIAKALRLKCRIFILDEPTAALNDHETERLFDVIAGMKRRGTAIIYISHRLDEIVAIADRCTVLRDGQVVSTRKRGTFSTANLIHDMTGKMADEVLDDELKAGPPLIEEVGDGPDHLTVRKNEAVGLAGLLGSGTDRMVRRLFGLSREAPLVRLDEGRKTVRLRRPADAISSSIGFVPGERALGLVMSLSVRDNILLPSLAYDNNPLWINRKAGDAVVAELMELLDIRPRRPDLRVSALSGGNQQKVIIAKWLARGVQTLLLDEPTHGIDIAAKMHVHSLIRKFTSEGGGAVVSSSDLGEMARICDRVLAVRNGRIVDAIDRKDGLDEAKLRASIGGMH